MAQSNIHIYKSNIDILNSVFNRYNMFLFLKLSNYLTLVDESNNPLVIKMDDKPYFFTFNKYHYGLNLGNYKNGFTFFEKMYIAGVAPSKYKWVNMSMLSFHKNLKKYIALEPRHFSVQVDNGRVSYSVLTNSGILGVKEISYFK